MFSITCIVMKVGGKIPHSLNLNFISRSSFFLLLLCSLEIGISSASHHSNSGPSVVCNARKWASDVTISCSTGSPYLCLLDPIVRTVFSHV